MAKEKSEKSTDSIWNKVKKGLLATALVSTLIWCTSWCSSKNADSDKNAVSTEFVWKKNIDTKDGDKWNKDLIQSETNIEKLVNDILEEQGADINYQELLDNEIIHKIIMKLSGRFDIKQAAINWDKNYIKNEILKELNNHISVNEADPIIKIIPIVMLSWIILMLLIDDIACHADDEKLRKKIKELEHTIDYNEALKLCKK